MDTQPPPAIKRLEVRGLYGRLDLDLDFNSDLTILYGRNGAGKTTILNILANAVRGDLERFYHLRFRSIRLELANGQSICIEQEPSEPPSTYRELSIRAGNSERIKLKNRNQIEAFRGIGLVAVDLSLPHSDVPPSSHSLQARESLKDYFAFSTPMYFPAFRTMIEAWSGNEHKEADPQPWIRYLSQQLFSGTPTDPARTLNRRINITGLARGIFGEFTPSVNFPAPQQIETAVDRTVTSAVHRVTSQSEAAMSEAFIDAFTSVTSDVEAGTEEPEALLEEIESYLDTLRDTPVPFDPDMRGSQLIERLRDRVKTAERTHIQEHGSSLLTIYRDSLKQQLRHQRREFAQITSLIKSINAFLEEKEVYLDYTPDKASIYRLRVRFTDGAEAPISVLSSGERQILTMLYATIYGRPENRVILIDEPELSLHVDWQRRLLPHLYQHLAGRQIIVCTHSPVIGADYDDKFYEVKSTLTKVRPVHPVVRNDEEIDHINEDDFE